MDGKNTIRVDVQATVTEQTVLRCLKLIEWWLNDNPDKAIHGGYRGEDGLISPLEICESNVRKKENDNVGLL